jgi:hypothetical protein
MRVSTKVVIDIESGAILEHNFYEYQGALEHACGPTNAEQDLQNSSSGFSKTLQSTFGDSLANQNVALGKLNSVLSQIQGGTTAQGFGPEENAA